MARSGRWPNAAVAKPIGVYTVTDLISKLADSIVAMINASPRSPTKEEIAASLQHCIVLAATTHCPQCGVNAMATYAPQEDYTWAGLCTHCGWLHNLHEQTKPSRTIVLDDPGIEDLPPEAASALKKFVDVYARSWLQDYEVELQRTRDAGRGWYAADIKSREAKEKRDCAAMNEPFEKAKRPCPHPNHPDGEHHWHAYDKHGLFCEPGASWDVSNGSRLCICGATKP